MDEAAQDGLKRRLLKANMELWRRRMGIKSNKQFANDIGVGYSTCIKWIQGVSVPRTMAKNLIAQKYPDCPLLNL